jgi:hypothetical protein
MLCFQSAISCPATSTEPAVVSSLKETRPAVDFHSGPCTIGVSQGRNASASSLESDSILTSAVNVISNSSINGDTLTICFKEVVGAMSYALATSCAAGHIRMVESNVSGNQGAAAIFINIPTLPSLQAILARIALLRSFN